jgi:hypothetical protein
MGDGPRRVVAKATLYVVFATGLGTARGGAAVASPRTATARGEREGRPLKP